MRNKPDLRHTVFVVLALIATTLTMSGCHKKLGPTVLLVEDSVRHYPAIILGEELELTFLIRNAGDETLVLTDVQPSCPTIDISEANTNTVPPGEEALLSFTFHSEKNIGLAQHSIRLFGNIAPHGVAELIFDTHVVRPSVDLSDYEEQYQNKLRTEDGQAHNDVFTDKVYYTDSLTKTK